MKPGEAEDFLQRGWEEAAAATRAYWAERYAIAGWRATWDASQALLAHIRSIQPEFPTQRDRALDLAYHVALRTRLDHVAHAFARR